MNNERLLTSRETAAVLGVHWNTTKKWRCQGRGPEFVRHERSVRYTLAAVQRFQQGWHAPQVTTPPNLGAPTEEALQLPALAVPADPPTERKPRGWRSWFAGLLQFAGRWG